MTALMHPTNLFLGSKPGPGVPVAWWDSIEDPEGYRLEIIRGELSMTPSPSGSHQVALTGLIRGLDPPAGYVAVPDFDWRLAKGGTVAQSPRPDLMVIPRQRVLKFLTEAPLLAIEIISPSDLQRYTAGNDLKRIEGKRIDYAENGLQHYLEIDLITGGEAWIIRYELQPITVTAGGETTTMHRLMEVESVSGAAVLRVEQPFPYELSPNDF